jgi:hypothetical protein
VTTKAAVPRGLRKGPSAIEQPSPPKNSPTEDLISFVQIPAKAAELLPPALDPQLGWSAPLGGAFVFSAASFILF